MPSFTDQLGSAVIIENTPKRIISLVPSQTELLYDLGLDTEVIGITKFCVHPEHWFKTKQRVGGTKTVDIEKVKALQPDLIIANKEENVKEQIESLQQIAPVWISNISNLNEALQMISSIGTLVSKKDEAEALISRIRASFNKLTPIHQFAPDQPSTTNDQLLFTQPPTTNEQPLFNQTLNTAYLIWRNPYMAAGGDTFIGNMLAPCGLNNIMKDESRYPEVTIQQLSSLNCQLLLLSSEPYPFKQQHIDEMQAQLPNTKIMLVDGEMFSWYGSRLLHAAEYFKQLFKQIY